MTANAKSYIDSDTGKLVSLWRKLDEIIPVKLSGSHPLPPPQSRPAMEQEAENI